MIQWNVSGNIRLPTRVALIIQLAKVITVTLGGECNQSPYLCSECSTMVAACCYEYMEWYDAGVCGIVCRCILPLNSLPFIVNN
jgi:hypothetical protein